MLDEFIYVEIANIGIARKGGVIGLFIKESDKIVCLSSFFSLCQAGLGIKKKFLDEEIEILWRALNFLKLSPEVGFVSRSIDITKSKTPDADDLEKIGGILKYQEIVAMNVTDAFKNHLNSIIINQKESLLTL